MELRSAFTGLSTSSPRYQLTERSILVWIDVKYCSPLKKDSQAFDQLLQPSHTKDAIRTLVQDFRQSTSPALRGSQRRKRSENLTILLHGSSGTGKRYVSLIKPFLLPLSMVLDTNDCSTDCR